MMRLDLSFKMYHLCSPSGWWFCPSSIPAIILQFYSGNVVTTVGLFGIYGIAHIKLRIFCQEKNLFALEFLSQRIRVKG